MLVDVHAKSSRSDGVTLSVRDVLERAQKAGLSGVAFCETLSTAYCQQTLDEARAFEDLAVFIGVEIPTDKGILLGFVPEIDEFYLAEEWRRLTEITTPSAEDVMDLFESYNGVVIAARPYDLEIPFNMGDLIFGFDRVAAVEVFTPRVGEIQQNFALEAAAFMGVPTVGGSDPRDAAEDIGKFATFFDVDLRTQRQFVDALRGSEYWAVQLGEPEQRKSSRRRSTARRGGGGGGGGGGGRGRRRSSRGRGRSRGRRK